MFLWGGEGMTTEVMEDNFRLLSWAQKRHLLNTAHRSPREDSMEIVEMYKN